MRDIVATIQPEQDELVRAELDQTICVQGARGTGKTAVGLHRVAYLLYAYTERVARRGVLVVGRTGPSWPTSASAAGPGRGRRPPGDGHRAGRLRAGPRPGQRPGRPGQGRIARMATVLRRALWSHLAEPAEARLMLARGSRRWRVSAYDLAGLAAELRARGLRCGAGPGPAGAPDRARHPDPDGSGGGVLR